jgi:hypothetical protein
MDVANDLYVDGLKLDSDSWQDYLMTVSPQSTETVNVSLNVPSDYTGIGAMEGKVVFWAETG